MALKKEAKMLTLLGVGTTEPPILSFEGRTLWANSL